MASLPQPKGILFDIGNTVIREERHEPSEGFDRLLDFMELPLEVNRDDVLEWACDIYAEVRDCRDRSPLVELRLQSILRLLSERFAIVCQLTLSDLELELWKGLSSFRAEVGIGDVLQKAEQRAIAVGAVSNSVFSARIIEWELERLGLLAPFRFVMATADYGIQKPHRAIFETAVVKLGLHAEEVWFVGDNYSKDIVGASQAGLSAVWYNPQGTASEGEAVAEVRSWAEFGRFLDECYER